MNWYAHAVVAERRSSDPRFVLGAMLPDFAAVLGLRAGAPDAGAIGWGMRLHGETDARFHAAPEFLALQARARGCLEAAGLARGSARGAAHVGIELALDGWLAARHPRSPAFRAALHAAAALDDPGVHFRGRFERAAWLALCARLAAGELPEAYAEPERSAVAVERALAQRPRLALAPGARAAVADWLRGLAPELDRHAPMLLARCGG